MIKNLSYFLIITILVPKSIELPRTTSSDQIVYHNHYTLNYSEEHEQASWIAYSLSARQVDGSINRTNDFRSDPLVKTGSASLNDYKGSGYDRGHLVPAADMKRSYQAMSESFYLSNMSPQSPSFNRGIWKKLEKQIRDWALSYEKIYIVTGGILDNSLSSIGPNDVSVPKYFYKVILDYEAPEFKGIGFILPNKKSNHDLNHYAVSIDEVERVTNIDFFASLPDDVEDEVESKTSIHEFDFQQKGETRPGKKSYGNIGPVNINDATKSQLMRLPGIGDKLSDKIILHRKRHGSFNKLDQLMEIKGIGRKTIEKIRPHAIL